MSNSAPALFAAILILFLISSASCRFTESNLNKNITYLIKFLSQDTLYPIVLKDKSVLLQKNYPYSNTKWFKSECQCFVEPSKYFGTEFIYGSDKRTKSVDLLLLKFEKRHYLLDNYEPRHFYVNLTQHVFERSTTKKMILIKTTVITMMKKTNLMKYSAKSTQLEKI